MARRGAPIMARRGAPGHMPLGRTLLLTSELKRRFLSLPPPVKVRDAPAARCCTCCRNRAWLLPALLRADCARNCANQRAPQLQSQPSSYDALRRQRAVVILRPHSCCMFSVFLQRVLDMHLITLLERFQATRKLQKCYAFLKVCPGSLLPARRHAPCMPLHSLRALHVLHACTPCSPCTPARPARPARPRPRLPSLRPPHDACTLTHARALTHTHTHTHKHASCSLRHPPYALSLPPSRTHPRPTARPS